VSGIAKTAIIAIIAGLIRTVISFLGQSIQKIATMVHRTTQKIVWIRSYFATASGVMSALTVVSLCNAFIVRIVIALIISSTALIARDAQSA
jgi:hypothetical protein